MVTGERSCMPNQIAMEGLIIRLEGIVARRNSDVAQHLSQKPGQNWCRR